MIFINNKTIHLVIKMYMADYIIIEIEKNASNHIHNSYVKI